MVEVGARQGEGQRRVLLIGGSPERSSDDTIRRAAAGCAAVVAIDRGLDAADAAGVPCDLFCGDGDSVSARGARRVDEAAAGEGEQPFAVERYDPHKDDTDLSLALRAVALRWPGAIVRATCFGGGAPDHFIAVMGRFARAAAAGARIEIWEDGYAGRILRPGDVWTIEGARGRRFSFVALSEGARVSEAGMRWELDHHHVELLGDLGISNVIEADLARMTCHEGVVAAWVFA